MQALRKASEKKEKAKEEEKLKKSSYNISTPRDYLQKSSTTDIYGHKKKSSVQNAPRKSVGASSGDKSSPMKSLLKSSSSVSLANTAVYDKKHNESILLKKRNLSKELKTDSARNEKVVDSARRSVVNSARRSDADLSRSSVVESARRSVVDSARRSVVDSARSLSKAMTSTPESSRKAKDVALGLNKKFIESSSSMTPESARKLKVTKQNITPEAVRKTKDTSRVNRTPESSRKTKSLPPTNVSVNSPPMKKKISEIQNVLERGDSKEIGWVRQRTKTRTLDEDEVKVLTADALDNNAEMLNLTKRLSAKPKAFYVGLEDDNKKKKEKSSDEDYSYEDDFESYESDFESYHSSAASASEKENNDEPSEEDRSNRAKEGKDEENMLDSGSFDLRESQRSANKSKPALMENIQEDSEDLSDKKTSLTDEGFQEMSNSSAVSTMKTVHVDVLDRPLFMDFTKSKENRKRKKASERLKQRANDLLSIITLHKMSYSLFEMKPIPYDMYMATFGRSNYTQIAVQTFDDGINEEVQTEEILCETKWTQHPVEFSHHDIYLTPKDRKKSAKNDEDYISKFSILLNKEELDVNLNNNINIEKDYKNNPLRIYFEQKDGVGSCEMLPYEKYKAKVEDKDFNGARLSKFLKKVESRFCSIINENTGDLEVINLTQNSKLPFSKGYVSITTKTITNEQLFFVKFARISKVFFSETKPHLLMTAHEHVSFGSMEEKYLICLWDVNVARTEPLKVLVAIDNVAVAKYKGDTDGIFVAALNDGSLHLWDLSEEPVWENVASSEKPTNLVEVESGVDKSQSEGDKDSNFRNKDYKDSEKEPRQKPLQSCAYTSSACEMNAGLTSDLVTGLQLMMDAGVVRDGGRKVIGQVCVLQRIGKLIIWSIVQEKTKSNHDMGKAFWSKIKLEKLQTISLMEQFDIRNPLDGDRQSHFNMNAAKKRLSGRRFEKKIIRQHSRPKSAVSHNSSEFDIDRPASAASVKSVLPAEKIIMPTQTDVYSWESGVLCNDLKVMRWNDVDNYLVAKNCGEVLLCTRLAGTARVERFCVAKDMSSVTCVDVPRHNLAYFLAATDSGTINLCSLTDSRVLLTLDCRNGPPEEPIERCESDHLGRFVSTNRRPARTHSHLDDIKMDVKLSISSLHWSQYNPCLIYSVLHNGAVLSWELTHSDIAARARYHKACVASSHAGNLLALLTAEGEVQIHRLTTDHGNAHYLDLFQKYVALL